MPESGERGGGRREKMERRGRREGVEKGERRRREGSAFTEIGNFYD